MSQPAKDPAAMASRAGLGRSSFPGGKDDQRNSPIASPTQDEISRVIAFPERPRRRRVPRPLGRSRPFRLTRSDLGALIAHAELMEASR